MSVIAVDFDGVIHERTEYGDGTFGAPVTGAIKALNALHEAGNVVFIYTARVPLWTMAGGTERGRIRQWLREHGLTFEAEIHAKPSANVYIDDKAIRFDGWADVMEWF